MYETMLSIYTLKYQPQGIHTFEYFTSFKEGFQLDMKKYFFFVTTKGSLYQVKKPAFIEILKTRDYSSLIASLHCMIHAENIYAQVFDVDYEKCHKYMTHNQFLELLKKIKENIFKDLQFFADAIG